MSGTSPPRHHKIPRFRAGDFVVGVSATSDLDLGDGALAKPRSGLRLLPIDESRSVFYPHIDPSQIPLRQTRQSQLWRKTTMSITAFVLINAEVSRIDALGTEIADLDSVREVHSVAGSGVALIVTLKVKDHEDVAKAVTTDIAGLEGITDTQTLIAFRGYSSEEQQYL